MNTTAPTMTTTPRKTHATIVDDRNPLATTKTFEDDSRTKENNGTTAIRHVLTDLSADRLEKVHKTTALDVFSKLLNEMGEGPLLQMLQDVPALQQQNRTLQTKNEKILTNVRKKKALLEQATQKQQSQSRQLTALEAERDDLLARLTNAEAARDEFRYRLQRQKEQNGVLRAEQEVVEGKLAQVEHARAMERELLDLYRDVANHYGYYKFGKRIRVLESSLAEDH